MGLQILDSVDWDISLKAKGKGKTYAEPRDIPVASAHVRVFLHSATEQHART